jgi:hypothetical protein
MSLKERPWVGIQKVKGEYVDLDIRGEERFKMRN